MRSTPVSLAFCAGTVLLAGGTARAQGPYGLLELAPPPGGLESRAYTFRGTAAGGMIDNKPARWLNGVPEVLAMTPSGGTGFVRGIDVNGRLVGAYIGPTTPSRAFVWESGQTAILPLPGSWTHAEAQGVQNGTVVGFAYSVLSGTPWNHTACMWQLQGGTWQVTVLPSLSGTARAHDISPAGVPVGMSQSSTGTVGVRWDNGVATFFGWLGTGNYAYGLNTAGHAVGYGTINSVAKPYHFAGANLQELPLLPSLNAGIAYHITDGGRIAGWLGTNGFNPLNFDASERAVLWMGGAVTDLTGQLPAGSGWVLRQAWRADDAGRVAGWGTIHGRQRGYMLVPGSTQGACCMPDGTCSVTAAAQCTAAGGQFKGEGVACSAGTCAPIGACCLGNGTCVIATLDGCVLQGGVYKGDSSACGATPCVSSLSTTYTGVSTISGAFSGPFFNMTALQGDLTIHAWNVHLGGVAGSPSTVRIWYRPGTWVGFHSNAAGWTLLGEETVLQGGANVPTRVNISGLQIPAGQTYGIRIGASTGSLRQHSSASWVNPLQDANVRLDFGAMQGNVFTTSLSNNFGWNGGVYYTVGQSTPSCYANCDGSTIVPVLNVADFSCFLQKFAGQDAYANCDGSTVAPVLNVADFSCFLQKFAGGCP